MNKRAPVVVALVTVALLTGCDGLIAKFEIVRAGNQTFVLNKTTGDARLVDGVTLVVVKAPDAAPDDAAAKRAKNWPPLSISKLADVQITVRTKYRDGSMLYSMQARPFLGRLEKEFNATGADVLREPTVYIDFYDEEGFLTGEPVEVKIRSGTRNVNAKGEPQALSWTGSQPMSMDTYRAASSQSFRWAGFAKE